MKFISPKTDYAFKKIFGGTSSQPILISFLNALIYGGNPTITELQILDPYQSGQIVELKDSYLDVKATLNDGTIVIIEMQVLRHTDFDKRILYNAAKGYVNQLVKGFRYGELKPVIALTITDFNLFKNDRLFHRFELKEREILTDYLFPGIVLVFVELPKFHKSVEELVTITDKWLYFLKSAESLSAIPQTLENEAAIEQALNIANEANLTLEELDRLERKRFFLNDQEQLIEDRARLQNKLVESENKLVESENKLVESENKLVESENKLAESTRRQRELIQRLLVRQFDNLEETLLEQIAQLSLPQLISLTDAALDFEDLDDLVRWLAAQT